MTNPIPETINAFNVYKDGKQLIGISEEVQLPDFEQLTETLSGPGILGEFESSSIGHFGSMEIEIPYRTIDGVKTHMNPFESQDLTLRGAIQQTDASGAVDFVGMRVVVRGKAKKVAGGSLKQGSPMGSSVTLEIIYILIEIDGVVVIELDKLNCIYKVNDVDLLEKVRALC